MGKGRIIQGRKIRVYSYGEICGYRGGRIQGGTTNTKSHLRGHINLYCRNSYIHIYKKYKNGVDQIIVGDNVPTGHL